MEMCGFGEVVASSFDRPAERHTQVAEMTLARAQRLVEAGENVLVLVDSLTRMARAYNMEIHSSGRTLSGFFFEALLHEALEPFPVGPCEALVA